MEINLGSSAISLPNSAHSNLNSIDGKIFIRNKTERNNYFGIGLYGGYDRSSTALDTSADVRQKLTIGLDLRWAGRTSSNVSWYSFNCAADLYGGYLAGDKTSSTIYTKDNFATLLYEYRRSVKSDATNFGANIVFFKDNPGLLTPSERFPYSVSIGFNAYASQGVKSGVLTKTTFVNNVADVTDTIYPVTRNADEMSGITGTVSFGINLYSFPISGKRDGICKFGISPLDAKISYGYTNDFKFQPGFTLAVGPSIDDYSRIGQIASVKMVYTSLPGATGVGIMGTVSVLRLIDLFKFREY
ncbi:MAG: hypothetical protein WCK37_01365 [Candidatus Falkowbacteria bacterium]